MDIRHIGWLLLLLLLTSCALLDTTAPMSATPTPRAENNVIVDLFITIADVDSDEPVVADTVWLNNEVAYRNVSACILMLSANYPAEQDGYEIRIKAEGYQLWTTRIRPRARQSHTLTLPVHLQRAKPQSDWLRLSLAARHTDAPKQHQEKAAEDGDRQEQQRGEEKPVAIR